MDGAPSRSREMIWRSGHSADHNDDLAELDAGVEAEQRAPARSRGSSASSDTGKAKAMTRPRRTRRRRAARADARHGRATRKVAPAKQQPSRPASTPERCPRPDARAETPAAGARRRSTTLTPRCRPPASHRFSAAMSAIDRPINASISAAPGRRTPNTASASVRLCATVQPRDDAQQIAQRAAEQQQTDEKDEVIVAGERCAARQASGSRRANHRAWRRRSRRRSSTCARRRTAHARGWDDRRGERAQNAGGVGVMSSSRSVRSCSARRAMRHFHVNETCSGGVARRSSRR